MEERKVYIRQRSEELATLIDALNTLLASNAWAVLVSEFFHKQLIELQKKLEDEKEPREIYVLQGKIAMIRKCIDLDRNRDTFVNELRVAQENLKALEKNI